MGSTEMMLLMKYGIPLAFKLIDNGKESKEAALIAQKTLAGIESAGIVDELLAMDAAQSKAVVDSLYDMLAGVVDAFGEVIRLITAFSVSIPQDKV